MAPVSLLLDLWVHDVEALVGETLDPLRFRPNLYVRAAPGFAMREQDLVGATLRAGRRRAAGARSRRAAA